MERTEKQSRLLLIIIALFWFVQYIHVPFQTIYLHAIQLSSQWIGIIIGAYGIAQLALRVPFGVGADRNGNHKAFITTALAAAGTGALLRWFLPTGPGFLLANILSGTASAMWISFLVLYGSYYSAKEQRFAMGRAILANTTGIMTAFLFSTFIYPLWGMALLNAFGTVAAAAGILLAGSLAKPAPRQDPLPVGQLLSVVKNKRLLLFSGLGLISMGVQMATVMSFSTQVTRDLGASDLLVGLSTMAYMVASVIFARLGTHPAFAARFSKKVLVSGIFVLLAFYCLALPLAPNLPLVFLLQIIPGAATGILFALLTSEGMSQIPLEKKSTAMGYYQAIYAIGMTMFPTISGFLQRQGGFMAAFGFLGAACFCGAVISWAYYQKREVPGR